MLQVCGMPCLHCGQDCHLGWQAWHHLLHKARSHENATIAPCVWAGKAAGKNEARRAGTRPRWRVPARNNALQTKARCEGR